MLRELAGVAGVWESQPLGTPRVARRQSRIGSAMTCTAERVKSGILRLGRELILQLKPGAGEPLPDDFYQHLLRLTFRHLIGSMARDRGLSFDDPVVAEFFTGCELARVEDLGSCYESLLELRPRVTARTFELERAKRHQRKATGSYYT